MNSSTGSAVGTPDGMCLLRLSDQASTSRDSTRCVCLEVIKELYGYEYGSDWYAEMDPLLVPSVQNHHAAVDRRAIWTLIDSANSNLSTVEPRALAWKPKFVADFSTRYSALTTVGSLWRLHIRREMRRQGFGKLSCRLAERESRLVGYKKMYLHAQTNTTGTISFWKIMSYGDFRDHGETTLFDRPI